MPAEERPITQTFDLPGGGAVVLRDVPATVDPGTGEVIGYRLAVSRAIGTLLARAQADGQAELTFDPELLEAPTAPDPISLELRRAMRQRGLTGSEVARLLGVKPPLVSRWLSPNYHQHNIETLRRLADVLGYELEISLKPKAS